MAQEEKLYILDEVAERLGLDRDTIRNWEDKGKIPFKVKRNHVGWRVYSEGDIEKLKKLLTKLHPPEPQKKKRG